MQRIERYGVIALVFLLVTILAVSLWGESKGDGFFSYFKSGPKKGAAAQADKPVRNRPLGQPIGEHGAGERMLPLTSGEAPANPAQPGAQPLPTPDTLAHPGAVNPAVQTQGAVADPYAALRGPNAPANAPANALANAPANGLTNTPPTAPGVSAQPGQPLNVNPALNQPVARQDTPANPAQAATREYKVKPGDTLGEIASHELGSSARWVDIQRLNKMIEPSKLKVGMTLQLPVERNATVAANAPAKSDASAAPANAPKTSGTRKYTVQSGDSASVIASRELGSATRWDEIRSLNPGVDVEHLKVGTTLNLPAGGGAVAKESSKQVAAATPATSTKSKVK